MPLTIPRLILSSVVPIFCIGEFCYSIKCFLNRIREKTIDAYHYKACEAPSQKQKHKFAEKMSHGVLLFGPSQSFFNFLVRLVLPKGVDRPNHGWKPANQCELKHQAKDARKWPTNCEEGQPGQKERYQKPHRTNVLTVLSRTQVSTGWLTTNLHWSLK